MGTLELIEKYTQELAVPQNGSRKSIYYFVFRVCQLLPEKKGV
jgi:hypothetical protein